MLVSKETGAFLTPLGLRAAADDLGARTSGDVNPRIPLAILLRGAGTERLRGIAVVPPCLGDPVTLLELNRCLCCPIISKQNASGPLTQDN